MENEQGVADFIRNKVWSGFYDAAEIASIVADIYFEGTPRDAGLIDVVINREFEKKWLAEKSWPAETDYDRLNRVFSILEEQDILVLENAGFTLTDGLEDVVDAWYGCGDEDSGIVGYCFYHGQDLEQVVECGELCLAFGDILSADKMIGIFGDEPRSGTRAIEVGGLIFRELKAAGFKVEWDQSIEKRIEIKGITWQKRSHTNDDGDEEPRS